MFLSKESQQSARILGKVLNFPLYDGDCSPAARDLLEAGDVDGAIAEWQRLADLGSSRARCVLAYLALRGRSASIPPDLEESRQLASSALSGERGYANFVLGCVALKENQTSGIAQYLGESYKAGFLPAASLLAALSVARRTASPKTKVTSESVLRKCASAGYRPAAIFLCSLYLHGRFGIAKRVVGLVLLPWAFIRLAVAAKYRCFSVGAFGYSLRSTAPIFASQSGLQKKPDARSADSYMSVLAAAHAIAAILVVMALNAGLGRVLTISILAAWPYALSFWIAAANNARSLVGAAMQTYLMFLVTAFVCCAYVGHLVDLPLGAWSICAITLIQAFLLFIAVGVSASVAKQSEPAEAAPRYRRAIVVAQIILGLVAAGAVFARPALWRSDYFGRHAFDLAAEVLLALLPYVAVGLFSRRLVTSSLWRPWAYVGVLIAGTALAVVNSSGLSQVQPGIFGVGMVVVFQSIAFTMVAEWALDDAW